MIYLLITLIVLILVGLITLFSKFKLIREKYGYFFGYIIAVVLMIAGAVLSVYLADFVSDKSDKDDVIQLLMRAKEDVELNRINTAAFFATMTDSSKEEYTYASFFKRNPLSGPNIFFGIINNENVLKYINAEILESFSACEKNCRNFIRNINLADASNYGMRNGYNGYGQYLWYSREILKIAIDYIKGTIDDKTVGTRKQKLIRLFVGYSDKELDSLYRTHPQGNFDWTKY